MILIQLNKQDFEYDLHSLVKSFYPGEDVTVCYEEPENAGEALLKISVIYKEQEIAVRFEKDGQVLQERDEKSSEIPGLPDAQRLYGNHASMGDTDRHPAHEDPHGSSGAGHEQPGHRGLYAKNVSYQSGEDLPWHLNCQPGTAYFERYRL